jgi:hypothetical protein
VAKLHLAPELLERSGSFKGVPGYSDKMVIGIGTPQSNSLYRGLFIQACYDVYMYKYVYIYTIQWYNVFILYIYVHHPYTIKAKNGSIALFEKS